MMCSGIDLHSNNSVVAVIDDGDRVVAQKRLPNDIAKIVGFLARWQDELAGVVVGSTYNWYWLADGSQDAGFLPREHRIVRDLARKRVQQVQSP
jgi:transposase